MVASARMFPPLKGVSSPLKGVSDASRTPEFPTKPVGLYPRAMTQPTMPPTTRDRPQPIDARGPRVNQGVAAFALLVGFVFEARGVYPGVGIVLALSAVGGSTLGPVLRIYRDLIQPRLGPPTDLEDPRPPRFAAAIGTAFLAAATYALATDVPGLADALALAVAGLAALAAVTGLCVGCEAYVWWKKRSSAGWSPAGPSVRGAEPS